MSTLDDLQAAALALRSDLAVLVRAVEQLASDTEAAIGHAAELGAETAAQALDVARRHLDQVTTMFESVQVALDAYVAAVEQAKSTATTPAAGALSPTVSGSWRHEHQHQRTRQAIHDYSEAAAALNSGLRDDSIPKDSATWQDIIAPLDKAIRRSSLSESITVTRAVNPDWLPAGIDATDDLSVLQGTVIRERAFVSTSRHDPPRGGYAQRPIVLRMQIPAGAHALDLSTHGSEFAAEREMLLPRNSSWRVREVYRRGKQWIFECEVRLS